MNEFNIITSDLLQGEILTAVRDLHTMLKIKTPVHIWFRRKIKDAMLEEGVDYVKVDYCNKFPSSNSKTSEKNLGGRPSIDYAITDYAAKVICMLEKIEFRKFLISQNKILKKIESNFRTR